MKYDYFEDVNFLKGLRDAQALAKLERMTLLRVKGKDSSKSLLISGMLHGCEPCGFRAILKEINSNFDYPIDIYFLIGNVKAAKLEPLFTHRLLSDGRNYNRIWVNNPRDEDEEMAKEILNFLSDKNLQGNLDLHSFSSNKTKAHAFTPSLEEKNIAVARKLVDAIFLIDDCHVALTQETIQYGPAMVVECGTNNTKEADEFAFQTLQNFFVEMKVKEGENEDLNSEIFVDVINIKVKKDVRVVWNKNKQDVQLTLREDVESLNIKELPKGEFFGWVDNLDVFICRNKQGFFNPNEIFELREGKIFTRKIFVPNLMAVGDFITKESGFYFFTKASE